MQTADTYSRPVAPPPIAQPITQPSVATQAQTIYLEAADRIARFRRLADIAGLPAPKIDELYAPPGTVPGVDGPVPVVRVVFDERVLFDFDQAVPRPETRPVIDLVASNMARDVPDAALTILGHTDAVGSDAYNLALSQRRASTVFSELITRGVNPNQLSTVAIGKAQPIAPNSTEQGRALNRRVEFLISGSDRANLAVVQNREVNLTFLTVSPRETSPVQPTPAVTVLKPVRPPSGPSDPGILGPAGILTLRAPEPNPTPIVPAAAPIPSKPSIVTVTPATPAANEPVVPREPDAVLPATVRDSSPPNF